MGSYISKPSLFVQGLLLFVFGLIFLILNLIIANMMNSNCTLSPSQDNTTKKLLMSMNIMCGIIMALGMVGIVSRKYTGLGLNENSFALFYKWLMPISALVLLVCASYLTSIVRSDNFVCVDQNANDSLKSQCWGIMTMSSLYFIITIVLLYQYHKQTDEEKKAMLDLQFEEAKKLADQVNGYAESSIKDIALVNKYQNEINILEKAKSVGPLSIDQQLYYQDQIDKLHRFSEIAVVRNNAKVVYKQLQGNVSGSAQAEIIKQQICDHTEISDDHKVIMLEEIKRLLPTSSKLKNMDVDCKLVKELSPKPAERSKPVEQKPEQKSIESESPKLLTHVKPKTIEEDLQERIRVANLQEKLLDATSKVEAKKREIESGNKPSPVSSSQHDFSNKDWDSDSDTESLPVRAGAATFPLRQKTSEYTPLLSSTMPNTPRR